MSAGIVLITHEGVAQALLEQARRILDDPLVEIGVVEVGRGDADDRQRVLGALQRAERGAGVLVLTDLPGATPANVAVEEASARCRLVSGLNLPMLIRAWNYRASALEELTRRALEGGRRAVVELR